MGDAALTNGTRDLMSPEQIRNIVSSAPGRRQDHPVRAADRGSTQAVDNSAAEPRPSQSLGAASVSSRGLVINLLDTPGDHDFIGEVRAGLRGADAVLFVIPAHEEIDEPTRLLWRECDTIGVPRAVAVTKLEHARADFDETVSPLPAKFRRCAAVGTSADRRRPGHRGDQPAPTHRDRLSQRRGGRAGGRRGGGSPDRGPPRHLDGVDHRGVRGRGPAGTASGGEEIDVEIVAADLQAAIRTARFFPIVPPMRHTGMGVEELYDLFEHGFPSPAAAPIPAVYTAAGEPFGELTCDPDGPLVAEVVRTTSDQFVGRLSLVRVFSGTLRAGHPAACLRPSPTLHRASRPTATSTTTSTVSEPDRCRRPSATRPARSRCAIAGDLVLVSKLHTAETSDTLSGTARPALIEPWLLPDPLLPVAIRATTRGEEEKLASALQRLVAEDVTLRLTHNAETHQIVLWAMGRRTWTNCSPP